MADLAVGYDTLLQQQVGGAAPLVSVDGTSLRRQEVAAGYDTSLQQQVGVAAPSVSFVGTSLRRQEVAASAASWWRRLLSILVYY